MRNEYLILSRSTVVISLNYKGNPLTAFISLSDLPKLLAVDVRWQPRWSPSAKTFYVQGFFYPEGKPHGKGHGGRSYQLHRFLLGIEKEDHLKIVIDHKDWDGLNNRRSNLQVVTRSINQLNRREELQRNNTSGYRGVTWDKRSGKWFAQVQVRIDGKRHCKSLGRYNDVHEAGRAATEYRRSMGVRI